MAEVLNIKNNYEKISGGYNELQDFIILFYEHLNHPFDYGVGEEITLVEATTLVMVGENPGIIQSEIAARRGRTLGAVSQLVAKLAKKGLVEKRKQPGNAKEVHLFTTEKGEKLAMLYQMKITENMAQCFQVLLQNFSTAEMETFSKMVRSYKEMLMKLNKEPFLA